MNGARDADATDLGKTLQPRRDVDAVAEQVAVALDHVADGDADAERHLPARRIGHVAGSQAFLDVDGAAHRIDGAGKLREHGIAGGVEDATAGLRDEIVHDLAVGGQTPQRLLFILGDQSGVTGNVRCEDRRDLAFHLRPAPGTPLRRQNAANRDAVQYEAWRLAPGFANPPGADPWRREWTGPERPAIRREAPDQCIAVELSCCWMVL